MNKKIILILIFIFTMLALFIWSYKASLKPKVITKTKVIYRYKTLPSKLNVEKLSDWIYHHSFRCSRQQASMYAHMIAKMKNPLLLTAIIYRESSFNLTSTTKVNGVPVIGLMQIYCTKDHLEQLRKADIISEMRDLYSPEVNIKAGAFILNDIVRINGGNIMKALKMYCGGSNGYGKKVLETFGQLTLYVR